MGLGFILAGIVFLFNPNIGVFDILPDFIGFLLIYRGLFRLSFPSVKMQDTRGFMWKLTLITAIRFLSILLLPTTSDTFTLVLVFVFAVLEAMYFIPGIISLFDGFYELGTRFDTSSVFDTRIVSKKVLRYHPKVKKIVRETVQKKVEFAERLKVYSIVFFLVKTVASVLPELTALQINDSFSTDARLHLSLNEYKPLFYGAAFIVVNIFGIIWLIRMLGYVRRIRKDTSFTKAIDSYFEENVASSPALCAAIHMKKVRMLYILAAVGSFMFLFDGVNIIPNAFSSVFLIIAFGIILRNNPEEKLLSLCGIAVSAAAGIMSILNMFIQIPYFSEYEAAAARHIANAAKMYKTVRVCGAIEYIIVLAMFAIAFIVFCRVIRRHAAYVGITGNTTQFSADARRRELLNAVYARVLAVGIVGVIYFLFGSAYFTISMYIPEIFFVNMLLCAIWLVLVIQAMSSSYENIYERLEMNY